MMNEERSCRKRRAERDVSRVNREYLNLLPKLVLLDAVGQKLCRVVRCPDDDSGGRGKRKLESWIPDDAWFRQDDKEQRDSQAVKRIGGFPEQRADLRNGEHHDGTAHGWRASRNGNVNCEECDCDDDDDFMWKSGRFQKNHEHSGEQNHMETANREHVHESRPLEIAP